MTQPLYNPMADLTPEIVDEVVAACKAGAKEAAEAFGRALDAPVTLSVGQPGSLDVGAPPEELAGPGLAVVWTVGDSGALVLLPESSGLLPPWCIDLDPTGQSKLATLAQELGALLLPEQFGPEDFKSARVEDLAEALHRGGVGEGAGIVALELSAEGKQGTARLIWPAAQPAMVLGAGEGPKAQADHPKARLQNLPVYARSLLRIKIPVVVTLAEKRQPLERIVELGPGSIIQFDKSCEEMLELNVGSHPVATGEAVKVGDKFGLRITSMIMPDERFNPVRPEPKKKPAVPGPNHP